jgi:hypothetical protein
MTCAGTRGLGWARWMKSKTAVIPKEVDERIAISQQVGSANAVGMGSSGSKSSQIVQAAAGALRDHGRERDDDIAPSHAARQGFKVAASLPAFSAG